MHIYIRTQSRLPNRKRRVANTLPPVDRCRRCQYDAARLVIRAIYTGSSAMNRFGLATCGPQPTLSRTHEGASQYFRHQRAPVRTDGQDASLPETGLCGGSRTSRAGLPRPNMRAEAHGVTVKGGRDATARASRIAIMNVASPRDSTGGLPCRRLATEKDEIRLSRLEGALRSGHFDRRFD